MLLQVIQWCTLLVVRLQPYVLVRAANTAVNALGLRVYRLYSKYYIPGTHQVHSTAQHLRKNSSTASYTSYKNVKKYVVLTAA